MSAYYNPADLQNLVTAEFQPEFAEKFFTYRSRICRRRPSPREVLDYAGRRTPCSALLHDAYTSDTLEKAEQEMMEAAHVAAAIRGVTLVHSAEMMNKSKSCRCSRITATRELCRHPRPPRRSCLICGLKTAYFSMMSSKPPATSLPTPAFQLTGVESARGCPAAFTPSWRLLGSGRYSRCRKSTGKMRNQVCRHCATSMPAPDRQEIMTRQPCSFVRRAGAETRYPQTDGGAPEMNPTSLVSGANQLVGPQGAGVRCTRTANKKYHDHRILRAAMARVSSNSPFPFLPAPTKMTGRRAATACSHYCVADAERRGLAGQEGRRPDAESQPCAAQRKTHKDYCRQLSVTV
jgi:hypothetical protein